MRAYMQTLPPVKATRRTPRPATRFGVGILPSYPTHRLPVPVSDLEWAARELNATADAYDRHVDALALEAGWVDTGEALDLGDVEFTTTPPVATTTPTPASKPAVDPVAFRRNAGAFFAALSTASMKAKLAAPVIDTPPPVVEPAPAPRRMPAGYCNKCARLGSMMKADAAGDMLCWDCREEQCDFCRRVGTRRLELADGATVCPACSKRHDEASELRAFMTAR